MAAADPLSYGSALLEVKKSSPTLRRPPHPRPEKAVPLWVTNPALLEDFTSLKRYRCPAGLLPGRSERFATTAGPPSESETGPNRAGQSQPLGRGPKTLSDAHG
ncbi:hypothetical protein GCM10012287_04800 [Streptomyces daqingensis]|uniref:Uncharacterized protein n=1 Tax=Streptomyces daqingensis TaxID=1472640 RepID=A0ABQ2LT92_9ACTN|nr:hypothetical protein GCM10012287_04800 [Streptomyces daqingensis]